MKVFRDLSFLAIDAAAVDRFVGALPAALPAGWTEGPPMDRGAAAMMGRNARAVRFIRARKGGMPETLLALVIRPGKAYVSNIVPNERGSDGLGYDGYNVVLEEFAAFAVPLAEQHGLSHDLTKPEAGVGRWLSPHGIELLESFSNLANKSTGSGHPLDAERWYKFIVQAHREDSPLDVGTLGRYLTEQLGWDGEHAHTLMLEYELAREILKAYDRQRE